MPPRRRSTRSSGKDPSDDLEGGLFRGGDADVDSGDDLMQVEADLGLPPASNASSNAVDLTQDGSDSMEMYVDLSEAAAPGSSGFKIAEQTVDVDTPASIGTAPQVLDEGGDESVDVQPKSEVPSTVDDRDKVTESHPSSSRLLASMPIYLSNSLPSSSSLHIFQYPTYTGCKTLPIPQSAHERGLKPAMRVRPRANRVEVELPLDMRPMVYNAEKGEQYAAGADAADAVNRNSQVEPEVRVKSEFGGPPLASSFGRAGKPRVDRSRRLEKTRLESSLMPPQTKYMIGVIRDDALHLTAVDSMHQLRPSMHYLDALEALKRQKDRRELGSDDEETEEAESAATKKAETRRKAQSINVTLRTDMGGSRGGGQASTSGFVKAGSSMGDSRDHLMRAEREAESERWVGLSWKDENSEEAAKLFDSQMFASSKTLLDCKTRPRDFLGL